jgi:hypothetical protein
MELSSHARSVDDIVSNLRQLFGTGGQSPSTQSARPAHKFTAAPGRDHGFKKPARALAGADPKSVIPLDQDFDGF